MLRYEVNTKAAASQKANDSQYQFQLLEGQENRDLLVIGGNTKKLSDQFSEFNYNTIFHENISSAYKVLEDQTLSPKKLPSAIICDLDCQGETYDLFSKVQGNHFLKTIPFIIVSGTDNLEQKKKAKDMGVDDFYVMPFQVEDLHDRIIFLQKYKSEKKRIGFSNESLFENRTSLLKRSFDVIMALIALILLSPLLLITAIIIKLESRGPVIYVSKRVGTGYQIFNLYKFRSMRPGADVELRELAHLNQYNNDGHNSDGPSFFKLDNDPRVTKFGRFMRATSIDELPQLFNVIKGDMSIVGNRPLPLYEAEQLTKDVWAKRFLAPAGLTGLWQVSRRGQEEMSVSERVILDNTYADRCSFWLDMKIILKTFPALISKIQS